MRRLTMVLPLLPALLATTAAMAETDEAPEYEMRRFQLVFLVPDPDFERDPDVRPDYDEHRAARVATASNLFLRNLINGDVALIAGPLPDGKNVLQVAILDLENAAEAERILQRSPAVETGRLRPEIYTWWAADGILRKPPDPDDTRIAHLGLLKRPRDAPDYPQEKLEELQQGHLANLQAMADSGDLIIAGPVENGGALRGILIFRTQDAGRIEELAARDPSIQAGRLELELHPWRVPRGSWVAKKKRVGQ